MMSFVVRLFSVTGGASFVQKDIRVAVRVSRVSVRVKVYCRSGVSATNFNDAIDTLRFERRQRPMCRCVN